MKHILSQIKTDNLSIVTPSNSEGFLNSTLFWIAIVEFIIIFLLILFIKKKSSDLTFSDLSSKDVKNLKSTTVDMDNLMNSINSSKDLFKKLSKVCHPDKFATTNKQTLAEEIYKEITKNKRNYKKLNELKNRAVNELHITIK